jgi:hypothetical protein
MCALSIDTSGLKLQKLRARDPAPVLESTSVNFQSDVLFTEIKVIFAEEKGSGNEEATLQWGKAVS